MIPKIKSGNQKTGTASIVKAVNAMGALPTRNFRRGFDRGRRRPQRRKDV